MRETSHNPEIVVPSQVNNRWWDERAVLHAGSAFYDTQRVIDGQVRLNDYEIAEVGDVTGKRMLHLQCHLGTESIGWARLGAQVTGLDFSAEVVKNAASLAAASNVEVAYVQGDVYEAPEIFGDEVFDIVYVNIGSLHWLPDIGRWAKIVERLLVPTGKLYVNEIHPVASVLAEDSPSFERDYFDRSPVVWDEPGSYADTPSDTQNNEHVIWDRPLSDIIMAIIDSGLVLTLFHERPGQEFQQFGYQEPGDDGRWYAKDGFGVHPSTFSLLATKVGVTLDTSTLDGAK